MPMRIKHPTRMPGGGGVGPAHLGPIPEDDLLVKQRPSTPEQQPYWPNPLLEDPGFINKDPAYLKSHEYIKETGFIKEAGFIKDTGFIKETGFINSQPSMAEFMTALPHAMGPDLVQQPQLSPHDASGGYGMDHGHGMGSPGVNVPEYPWMKEKKTTRKNSQQGKVYFILIKNSKVFSLEIQRIISRRQRIFIENETSKKKTV